MNIPHYFKHLVKSSSSVKEALFLLNELSSDAILFVVDTNNKLLGSLTDGDLRRGFLKNLGFDDPILAFVQPNPFYITQGSFTQNKIDELKRKNLKIIPILNENGSVIDILNFRLQHTIVPVDAVLMAGGEGRRLRPLTSTTPKPLLKIGDKAIIEHNIDRLIKYGIKTINMSINYLGQQIEDYFGNGQTKGAVIQYVREKEPLGTIGSILLVERFKYQDILVMNSDILTNIDFADFYNTFKSTNADMAVAATSYHVDVPYAVLEVDEENSVKSLKEKPRYTYYSNAGIYLLRKEILEMIPSEKFYDITDLMETLLANNKNIVAYPITGYWLDIGKPEDFRKAQEDIKHIQL